MKKENTNHCEHMAHFRLLKYGEMSWCLSQIDKLIKNSSDLDKQDIINGINKSFKELEENYVNGSKKYFEENCHVD